MFHNSFITRLKPRSISVKSYFEDTFDATVTKVDFIKEKKQEGKEQKRRRFCFLTLDDTDLVDELCIRHFHEVAGTRVEVKKAEPKGSRQRYYGGYYDYGYGPYPEYGAAPGYYPGPPEYYNSGYGYGYGPHHGMCVCVCVCACIDIVDF